mmetsp:Transcript_9923/g.23305  ORF Transcript_9923/g.23305 Transcript_9923/m.23305 type:complete len:205 (+) Transcript_9923:139-753(+)
MAAMLVVVKISLSLSLSRSVARAEPPGGSEEVKETPGVEVVARDDVRVQVDQVPRHHRLEALEAVLDLAPRLALRHLPRDHLGVAVGLVAREEVVDVDRPRLERRVLQRLEHLEDSCLHIGGHCRPQAPRQLHAVHHPVPFVEPREEGLRVLAVQVDRAECEDRVEVGTVELSGAPRDVRHCPLKPPEPGRAAFVKSLPKALDR